MIKIINESIQLTKDEINALKVLVGPDANAGIIDAKDILDKLYDGQESGEYVFDKADKEYLEYWYDLIKNHPNSPKVKFMTPSEYGVIMKIFYDN